MRRTFRVVRALWQAQRMLLAMPGVQSSAASYFGKTIQSMQQLVRSGAQSQQYTVTDSSGAAVINFGVTPGSNPAIYGMQFLNPATGLPIMFLGVDASGAPGLHVYDTSGVEQVRLGELATTPTLYGLGVLPYGASILQQIGGAISSEVTATIDYTTSGTAAANGGPTFSALIGPSGQALVFSSADIGMETNGDSVEMSTWVVVDGDIYGPVPGPVGTLNFNPVITPSTTTIAVDITQTLTGTGLLSGLTPGVHTFELWYQFNSATGSGTGSFSNRVLTVQPL